MCRVRRDRGRRRNCLAGHPSFGCEFRVLAARGIGWGLVFAIAIAPCTVVIWNGWIVRRGICLVLWRQQTEMIDATRVRIVMLFGVRHCGDGPVAAVRGTMDGR